MLSLMHFLVRHDADRPFAQRRCAASGIEAHF
jgi:hypothetical protein